MDNVMRLVGGEVYLNGFKEIAGRMWVDTNDDRTIVSSCGDESGKYVNVDGARRLTKGSVEPDFFMPFINRAFYPSLDGEYVCLMI